MTTRIDRQRNPSSSSRTGSAQPEKKRRNDGLGIGAPLTAAFIGGFLVIENLAGAGESGEADATAETNDALLFAGDDKEGDGVLGEQVGSAGVAAGGAVANAVAQDPEPAPQEDASLDFTDPQESAVAAAPAIAVAAAGAMMPEGADGVASEANLSFFNIEIGDGGADSEIDASLEEDILQRDQLVGTPGDDVLVGSDGDDAISGGSGDDIIHGNGGRDLLNGNEGDDQLYGGAGDDDLKGGAGDDILDGGADYDNLLGGSGDDVLIINGRHDVALDYDRPLNSGDDLLVVGQGYADDLAKSGIDSSTFFFSSEHTGDRLPDGVAANPQQVAVGIEHLTLEGTADHDVVADDRSNRLTGNDGSNVIHAGGGDDQVSGGDGDDSLLGGEGDDEMFGGAGDDLIDGGLGEDMLYGEGGDDVFLIGLSDNAVDTIFDHEGANTLKLEGITDETVEASMLGDDLYVTVDDKPVAKVAGYAGNEDSIAGIDFGQGLHPVETLLTEHQDLKSAVEEIEAKAADAEADDLVLTHEHLIEPTILGDPRSDQRLDGTDGDDWLSGFDGKDVLFGHEGDDILAGGDGADRLRGGAGDDRYLFTKGESGIDKIEDTEGRNLAEIKGYDRAEIKGAMLGDDLAVLVDGKVLFTVDDYASNPNALEGVQAGNKFVETEDLLA